MQFLGSLYREAQNYAVQNRVLKNVHQMLNCIVISRNFNGKGLWATGKQMIKESLSPTLLLLIVTTTSPSPSCVLFNFSHLELIAEVSIDRLLLLLTVSLMNAFPYFGGCLWKDSCELGTLINSVVLEGRTEQRQTFLIDVKSFWDCEISRGENDFSVECCL